MNLHKNATFRKHISSTYERLANLSEEQSERPFRPGGWSRKEVLGHLIDSALNNHQRFVRAAIEGSYQGPSYQENEWVRIHGYKEMPWNVLLQHWRAQNELLCEVVERIPEDRLETSCCVGNHAPVTLHFLIADYLTHLDHHVDRIASHAES